MVERKKVGVALGSGGARGMAHIGVLKVLEENNVPIDFLAGSSIGAIIGALYSKSPNAKIIEKKAQNINWRKIFDYTFPKKGLIKGEKIKKILEESLEDSQFKDLAIPLWITAFDLEGNQEVVFHKGDVIKAVRASISIPGVFVPVENKGRVLVDGGLVDPLPTEVLRRNGADIVIAVNVNKMKFNKKVAKDEAVKEEDENKIPNIFEITTKAIHTVGYEISEMDEKECDADFIIDVNFEDKRAMDFSGIDDIIDKGENTARKSLKKIRDLTKAHPFKDFLEKINENLGIKD